MYWSTLKIRTGFLIPRDFIWRTAGPLIINVPAMQWLYSHYDQVQGHQRRYSLGALVDVARRNRFKVSAVTVVAPPLIPVLALRKAILAMRKPGGDSYPVGFDSRGKLINCTVAVSLPAGTVASADRRGTSVMAVLDTD